MKLPSCDVIHRQEGLAKDATAFQVAQLHCLRSIAVSLELLAGMYGTTKSEELFGTVADLSKLHSVMTGGEEEEKHD